MKSKLFFELLISILLLTTVIIIGINSKSKINSSNSEFKQAYEKGLYDGFFRTVIYIDSMNYFKLGDINFTKTEVDSLLHKN